MSNVPVEFPKHIQTTEPFARCYFTQHHIAWQQMTALISQIWETHPNS